MTPKRLTGVNIAIGGKYLHDVEIRLAKQYAPGSVSSLSFPAHRHWAIVEKERVTISAQAPTVVQLYATGILPAVGSRTVAIEVDGEDLGKWTLESVASGETSAIDDMIVLRWWRGAKVAG